VGSSVSATGLFSTPLSHTIKRPRIGEKVTLQSKENANVTCRPQEMAYAWPAAEGGLSWDWGADAWVRKEANS
jgi:hypothetical protein